MTILRLNELAYAYPGEKPQVTFKQLAEDFIVTENLSFEPEGQGTHAFLKIQKKQTNTQWVIKQLAKFCQTPEKSIGYAGLKDRQAITTQWFSVNLEGITEPKWDEFKVENINILEQTYHPRKLKIGTIASNHFQIKLRNIHLEDISSLQEFETKIKETGIPNYFGEQRFGHNYQNIERAKKWFDGDIKVKQRSKKSIYLSAVRSLLFNTFLSSKIKQYGWDQLIDGEVMILDNSRSFFLADEINEEIIQRFKEADIHPSISLWGQGELSSSNLMKSFEQQQAEQLSYWTKQLENKGLKQDRRTTRVFPQELKSKYLDTENSYQIEFSLVSGAYATVVLRELFQLEHANDFQLEQASRDV